jgi:hypothetical protein
VDAVVAHISSDAAVKEGVARMRQQRLGETFSMHPLIENNREAIARLCRLHGVCSLEAFGSILRDDFDAGRSDVDVLVEFDAQAADSFSNL